MTRNMRKRIISSSSWASHSGLNEGFQVRGDGWAMGEVRGPGLGDLWRFSCGPFKFMDLSFPEKISPSPCLCLSPALLLNQGEWSYFWALGGGSLEGGSWGWVRPQAPLQIRFEADCRCDQFGGTRVKLG